MSLLTAPSSHHTAPFAPCVRQRNPARRPFPAQTRATGGSSDEAAVPVPGAGAAVPPLAVPLSSRAVGMSSSSTQATSLGPDATTRGEQAVIGKWAEQYRAQQKAASNVGGSSEGDAGSGGGSPSSQFLLPLMTLSKCKMPTESVPLQIFEPRYRLMFKLVNQSASRRFGVVLADKNSGLMESVGALCELTHFVTVPERRRLFINARVIGRFQTQQIVNDKPFLAVLATPLADTAPQELTEQLQLAALELRVWQAMQDVRQLASKLFVSSSKLGNDIFNLEVRRWSPDAEARSGVMTVAGADPTLLRMIQLAGLLGDEETMAERTTEYLCSDATRQVCEDERRERFSFALARTLDFTPQRLQQLLYTQNTAERLRAAEELILEGRSYLAARSTLRDMF